MTPRHAARLGYGLVAAGVVGALVGLSRRARAEPALEHGDELLPSDEQPIGPVHPIPAAPPLTLAPGGRYMTAFERYALKGFLPERAFDTAKLWFGRPRSSFTQERDAEQGLTTLGITTRDGIFFTWPNHELETGEELAILAHELVHWIQHSEGKLSPIAAENEYPAYQMQLGVEHYLGAHLYELRAAFDSGERRA